MTELLIKLGVRFLVFGAAFWLAAWKMDKVVVKPRFAVPLVALIFALLNTCFYVAASFVLDMATLGQMGFLVPFVLNGLFLYATARIVKYLQIEGSWTLIKLAAILTVVHGVLYLGLDYFPNW